MATMATTPGTERLLLRGAWLPVTTTVNFLRAGIAAVVELHLAVRGRVVLEQTGQPLVTREVRASLSERLGALLPLVSPMATRELFIPVVADDGTAWTAYVNNSRRGIEMGLALIPFATRGILGVSVSELPHTYDAATNLGWWGRRKVEVLEPGPAGDFTGHSLGVRTTDSGRWEVVGAATDAPFPDPTDRTARRVADRFTREHLVQVAAFYGLRPFDEDFYGADAGAVLVEDRGPRDLPWRSFTLEQARENGRGVLWSHVEDGRVVQLP